MEKRLRKVDLHIHTVYSDGTYTPLQVVQLAKKLGLAAISITDHDSVESVQEALKVANKVGIELVPGVEMSSGVGQDEIHILGYYLNWQDKKFLAKLRFFQQIRMERNEKLLKRLKEIGIEIRLADLNRLAPKGVIGRLHIARIMMNKRYISSIDEAFERWLNPGKPAYVEKMRVSPFEVIRLILDAEGIPVLAHPFLSKRDDLIPKLVKAGLQGIEVYHSSHDPSAIRHYIKIARAYNLIITGGSDCHGEAKDGGPLMGKVEVPAWVLSGLKKAKVRILETAKVKLESVSEESRLLVMEGKEREGLDEQ